MYSIILWNLIRLRLAGAVVSLVLIVAAMFFEL